jgi:hypothetical protein
MSICNLEHKAKERRLVSGAGSGFVPISLDCHVSSRELAATWLHLSRAITLSYWLKYTEEEIWPDNRADDDNF